MPADVRALARLQFTKDGAARMIVVGETSEGSYKLVGAGKIDVTFNPREDPAPGIYQFNGDDRVMICVPRKAGQERPADFAAAAQGNRVLLTLTRARPGEEKPTPEEVAKFAKPAARVQEAVARRLSAEHLQQIGAALHRHDAAHNALPPAAIHGKDGKTPLLSWRVAILPYLEQEALYKEFKLDEPWDSAHNKTLVAKIPAVYEVPIGAQGKGLTHYQVFTGPGTLFDGTRKFAVKDLGKRAAETVLIVEATDPVIWTKPADLTLPKEQDKRPAVGGLFTNGFHVLLANGAVHMMAPTAPPALLRSLVLPKDGD